MRQFGMKSGWIILSLVAICGGCKNSVSITVPGEVAQAATTRYFPIDGKDYADEPLPVDLTLSNPQLLLAEGTDRIGLEVDVLVAKNENSPTIPPLPNRDQPEAPPRLPKLPGGFPSPPGASPPAVPEKPPLPEEKLQDSLEGKIVVTGNIDYRVTEGAFYLDSPEVESVSFVKLPEELESVVRKSTGKVLGKYFQKNPVYVLSDEDGAMQTTKMLLKSVSVKDGSLTVELGLPEN